METQGLGDCGAWVNGIAPHVSASVAEPCYAANLQVVCLRNSSNYNLGCLVDEEEQIPQSVAQP